ncbi:putative ABC transporter arginine-binding protein ArtJ, partial [Chlamydia psittaci 84-8471/1]
MLPIPPLNLL